jgi:predicted nuclease of predicted toxin-antitoxin system
MAKFLLDANLSPRVGRFLVDRLHLDVTSLQGQRLGELPDHEVIRMARQQRRVIITLDRDYSDFFQSSSNRGVGIIYLDLPNRLRYIPEVNRLLATIFEQHADSINLETSLVTIGEDHIVIQHDRQAYRTTLVHQSG